MSNTEDARKVNAALHDPYTTEPGAFTAARAAGLVEVVEGQPVRTKAGEALLRDLLSLRARGCEADDHGPEDPRF